jgi:hypothetical protein
MSIVIVNSTKCVEVCLIVGNINESRHRKVSSGINDLSQKYRDNKPEEMRCMLPLQIR